MPARGERAEASRRRILEAAARCFCELGYARTRFDDIAAGAGVSRALVYNYFGSKQALLREVRDGALAAWRESVEPAIDSAATAQDKLAAMIRQTLLFARERPLLQAILADDARVIVLGEGSAARPGLDAWRRRIAAILRAGVAAGELRADLDVRRTADVLRAMQMGIIDRMHREPAVIDVRDSRHVDAAVQLLLHGVCR